MRSGKNMSSHLDRNVFIFFIVVFLLAAGSFSFRYANYEPCDEIMFSYDINDLRAGKVIQFEDKSEGAKKWEWDFGDGTGIKSQREQLHVFDKAGDYNVRLVVNNKCERIETVHVKPEIILLDSTKFPVFNLAKSIRVGQKLIVTDETENASSWEWRFGESANIDASTKTAEYIYEEPGLKTVSLIVNEDLDYISKKKINVIPSKDSQKRPIEISTEPRRKGLDLPRAPKSTKFNLPKAPKGSGSQEGTEKDKVTTNPSLSDQNLKTKLQMISKGQMAPEAFAEFFCSDPNPLVVANGRNYTFRSLCDDVKGKNIAIETIKVYRAIDMNCIKSFNIDYKEAKDN
ncbi:PKD domain-containing protein [Eudoraea adriatica]|uniref:PKD domain-containing protein n=1 Tax=Eudoraea adriatica TaxID=446681 RepID=UPI00037B608A|nr:PKD domain-containing protein [Eudoraea adriatica]